MVTSVLSSLFIASLFALILSFAFRRSGPGPVGGLVFIFLIIFMFSWAVGGWIQPLKSYQVDYPWLSPLLIGLFIMLLLGALLPPSTSQKNIITKRKVDEEVKARETAGLTISFFFWIMFVVLMIAGIVRWI